MLIHSTHFSVFQNLDDSQQKNAAMSRFVDLYRPAIFQWCRKFELQDADAEDVTQMILTKMLGSLNTFDPNRGKSDKGRFRSWLKSVVHNAATDFKRKRGRRLEGAAVGGSDFQDVLANLASDESILDLSTSLDGAEQSDPMMKSAVATVRSLTTANVWQAFEQTVQFDRDAKEVAQKLGMTVGAVYQAKYRVRDLLKKTYLSLAKASDNALPKE